MAAGPAFPSRSLRIVYWNAEARLVDSERLALEHHLQRLGDVRIVAVGALDAAEARPADLLIIAAQKVPEEEFPRWLTGLRRRITAASAIWTPALILADASFDTLSDIWADVTRDNWYFDILAPAHISSLPVRVANLLRIHDHLHELRRYAAAVDEVTARVKDLEARVSGLAPTPGTHGSP